MPSRRVAPAGLSWLYDEVSDAAFGLGIYGVQDAARLIGMQAGTLRRWLMGYSYRHAGSDADQPALWRPQYGPQEGELLLGFRDLIEARIVHALRSRGIGLPTIRLCLDRARAFICDQRPLSTRQFKTDGRTIFLEITEGLDEPQLVDLKRRQGVFRTVVEPSLSGLEFGTQAAERWWLLPGKQTIVADPAFAFGQPTAAGRGVTTTSITQAIRAEGSVQRVAQLYDLKAAVVRDAERFEALRGLPRAA